MRHALELQIGPASFRVGSQWRQPIRALQALYEGYPVAHRPCEFTVRLEAEKPWRRWVRPSVAIQGDYMLPGAVPMALSHGLLAAEMGMNLQMALGQKRYLLLHAASVERDGKALLITGESGAGKSTLAALLGENGWRLMGDEFALLDPATGMLHPFPRAVSLKNGAIAEIEAIVGRDRLGPRLEGTPKGSIRHLRPNADAIARMAEPAAPMLILFPRFGADLPAAVRPVGMAEAFVRLTQASTNYVQLGLTGFEALTGLVTGSAGQAIDYPDTATALALAEQLWAEQAA
jgi:HprK-related kinase A